MEKALSREHKTSPQNGLGVDCKRSSCSRNRLLRRVRATIRAAGIYMHSSALLGIPPELPAAHGPLPGVDETARLPLPVPMLSPWAASKRPAGALSPTDVALSPTSPCTDEGGLREASHMPGTFPPEGAPTIHPAGLPPAPPRSTEHAREPFYPFFFIYF